MDTDADREMEPFSRWFKAPFGFAFSDEACAICKCAIRTGEIIAEDGAGFIHQNCYNDAREDHYDAARKAGG